MNKLKYLLILFSFILLTGCKLAISTELSTNETTTSPTNSFENIIGFKIYQYNNQNIDILDDKQSTYIHKINDPNMTVYDNHYFSNTHIDIKENTSQKTVEITTDYHVVMSTDSCFNLAIIYQSNDGKKLYEEMDGLYCASVENVGMALTVHQSQKINDYEESISFKVNFKHIDQLMSYTVVQYDASYNIIKQEQLQLSTTANKHNEYVLEESTKEFKIIEQYRDYNGTIYEKRKYYTQDNFKYTNKIFETVYNYDEQQERNYYTFIFISES